jgi:hypothetical protein
MALVALPSLLSTCAQQITVNSPLRTFAPRQRCLAVRFPPADWWVFIEPGAIISPSVSSDWIRERMSIGSVASQMESMRIIAASLEARSHKQQHFQLACSP